MKFNFYIRELEWNIGHGMEDVDTFIYLGGLIIAKREAEEDIKNRMWKVKSQ